MANHRFFPLIVRRRRRTMNDQAIFELSILMSFLAFGTVTKLLVWPRFTAMHREDALIHWWLHTHFGLLGSAFLVPGVVSPSLPAAFAVPVAYGDLGAAILAVVATLAGSSECILRRSDRCSYRPRIAWSRVLYLNGRRTTAVRYTRTEILAAAKKAMKRAL